MGWKKQLVAGVRLAINRQKNVAAIDIRHLLQSIVLMLFTGVFSNAIADRGDLKIAQLLMLQKEVAKVSEMPTGLYDCYVEHDEGEPKSFKDKQEKIEYERKKKQSKRDAERYVNKCNSQSRREATAYSKARNALNNKWLSVLKGAVNRGDMVAEVIMRSCETATTLDRSGFASNCSETPEDREFARVRLEAIGFRPALYQYEKSNLEKEHNESLQRCAKLDKYLNERCRVYMTIERYKRVLNVMKTGYLGIAEMWNTCPIKSTDLETDMQVEECQRLLYLTFNIISNAPRSYIINLSLERNDAYPERMDSLILARATRLDWSAFRDSAFQEKFEKATDQAVRQIEANIKKDLARDPRWGVFLVNRFGDRQLRDPEVLDVDSILNDVAAKSNANLWK